MKSADYIAKIRALDPTGECRVVVQEYENVGADGGRLDDPRDPSLLYVLTIQVPKIDLRTGKPYTYVEEEWFRSPGVGTETVVVL